MLLKIIGIGLIIVSSNLIGINFSRQLEGRLIDVRSLKLCLGSLKKEIVFLSNPIPDALLTISNIKSNLSGIFKECGTILKSKKGYCVDEAWEISVENNFKYTCLKLQDKELLLSISKGLGTYDKEHQSNYIDSMILQLESLEKDALDLVKKNVKLYKSLSIFGGLAIVILLI